jgi:hypothetical protein
LYQYNGQTIYVAFVRHYTQPTVSLSGDRWLIDNISINGDPPPAELTINNIHGSINQNLEGNGCEESYIGMVKVRADNGSFLFQTYSTNGAYDMNVIGNDF